jgi:hypothetical protein
MAVKDAAQALGGGTFVSLGLEATFIDREPTKAASTRVAERLGAADAGSRFRLDGLEVELVRHRLTPQPLARISVRSSFTNGRVAGSSAGKPSRVSRLLQMGR